MGDLLNANTFDCQSGLTSKVLVGEIFGGKFACLPVVGKYAPPTSVFGSSKKLGRRDASMRARRDGGFWWVFGRGIGCP